MYCAGTRHTCKNPLFYDLFSFVCSLALCQMPTWCAARIWASSSKMWHAAPSGYLSRGTLTTSKHLACLVYFVLSF